MKKFSLALLVLAAMSASVSFAEDVNPSVDNAQARAQAFQNMTPDQQQAAINAAKQQGQATAQQKQQNWNSMTPEQQQAQKDSMQTNMQSKMQGMKSQMQGGGQMQGGMMQKMRSRMGGM
jgi:opacity protein-like surface antigen